jgi:hypothetical protein
VSEQQYAWVVEWGAGEPRILRYPLVKRTPKSVTITSGGGPSFLLRAASAYHKVVFSEAEAVKSRNDLIAGKTAHLKDELKRLERAKSASIEDRSRPYVTTPPTDQPQE